MEFELGYLYYPAIQYSLGLLLGGIFGSILILRKKF